MRVAVLGAGCVGQFLGAHLASEGVEVLLLGRQALERSVKAGKLQITDLERDAQGFELSLALPSPKLKVSFDQGDLKSDDFDAIFVCLKLGDTKAAACLQHLRKSTVIISVQNGINNKRRLEELLPGFPVVSGMVPYGVIELAPGRLRRSSMGPLLFDDHFPKPLAAALAAAGLALELQDEVETHQQQCFKLVVNCHNALNALVGLPLAQCLQDGLYRQILAATWEEALEVFHRSGQKLDGSVNGMPMSRNLKFLRLPSPLFGLLVRLKPGPPPDPNYHASMFYDLEQKRRTEIDELNGAVVAMADSAASRCRAPVNAALARLVRAAEEAKKGSPRLSPEAILREMQKDPSVALASGRGAGAWLLAGCVVLAAWAVSKL